MNLILKSCAQVNLCVCLCIMLFGLSSVATSHSSHVTKTKSKKIQHTLWEEVSEGIEFIKTHGSLKPEKFRVFRLNQDLLKRIFAVTPLEFTEASQTRVAVVELPTPEGRIIRFRLEESPILSPEIAGEFPSWKTFQGYGIDDPSMTARLDWNSNGFHAWIFAPNGQTFLIDPSIPGDKKNYTVYFKRDTNISRPFHCDVHEDLNQLTNIEPFIGITPNFTNGLQLRTYRLAIATTGEYTAFFGSQTAAFAQVTTTVNRLTGVYRREFALNFLIISGTNLIYPDATTDPYDNTITSSQLTLNNDNINAVIGSANYDVGHLFTTSNNGLAQIGAYCGSAKGRGASGQPNPIGDPFDIDRVAHEFGHQTGAQHTFNADSDCGAGVTGNRVEPGSGATIMGYAGICSSVANLQRNSIEYFHTRSLTLGVTYITTGRGSTCGTLSGNNTVPVISALTNYMIPINTPFTLTANATDGDGDTLTYSWEQSDDSPSQSNYPNTTDDDDISLVARPALRSYPPVTTSTRNFPSLPYVLNFGNEPPITYTGTSLTGSVCAATCITGEDLPSAARTMNFRVVVRDGRGGVADAGMVLTVAGNTGQFQVTTQNSFSDIAPAVVWQTSSTQTVTWNVAGTDANGINVKNVNILLSTDGGQTFPITILANTPNDGTQLITVPNNPTAMARIKIEAVGNIFFDINNANFTISSPTAAATTVGGRVTNILGVGIPNAIVTITNAAIGEAKTIRTSPFGYYQFDNVTVGEAYILTVSHKSYSFPSEFVTVIGDANINFIGNLTGRR